MKVKKRVLIIEDDKFIARAYVDGMKNSEFDIEIATNGKEGIEMFKENRPDLILLDIVMPIKNGFEVLEEIKLIKEVEKVPIIVFSNLEQKSDITKARELGATEYWVKTDHSIKEVLEKINFYLAKKS